MLVGEAELCPEAEIVFGARRVCAMYASEQLRFAVKLAETINASLVVAEPVDGCAPIWDNAEAVNGSIVVVDRGACPFVDKAMNAQAAGAVAVPPLEAPPAFHKSLERPMRQCMRTAAARWTVVVAPSRCSAGSAPCAGGAAAGARRAPPDSIFGVERTAASWRARRGQRRLPE